MLVGMDTHPGMRVVGRLKGTPWERFCELQRAAANNPEFRWRLLVPKGVYRFKTHEEADAWEEEWKRKAAEMDLH